jgi:hypothetical protein
LLGIRYALRDGSFRPRAAFHGIEIAGGAVHQITPEHHLGRDDTAMQIASSATETTVCPIDAERHIAEINGRNGA